MTDQEKNELSKSALVWGILCVALDGVPVLGIVFSRIARARVVRLMDAGVPITGKAKAGQILALIGFIEGIVCTVLWAIIIACWAYIIPALFLRMDSASVIHL